MTLHTIVHLTGPISAEAAFDLGLRAVLVAAEVPERYQGAVVERDPEWFSNLDEGETYIGTEPGQGLPAWTDAMGYRDGRTVTPDPPDEDGNVYGDQKPWTTKVSWDTGYAYRGPRGESASRMHGAALRILHDTLPEGITLRWCNEFTAEWHDGLDGIEEFAGQGVAARDFAADVLAAFQLAMASGQVT